MKVLQQGQADGLCGIYAVLNFLQQTDWKEDEPEHGLWYLLDTCRQLGWFSPQHMTEGYEDYQLKAVLQLQFDNYRLPYKAYFVADVCEDLNVKSFSDLVERVALKRGSIIAHANRGHWVLVHCEGGKATIFDSASPTQKSSAYVSSQKALSKNNGVIILPQKRLPVEIDL